MTKSSEYLEEARRLYVAEHNTLKEIAEKLPVSYSTLRSWSRRDSWTSQRQEALLESQDFHSELYSLARSLSRSIREDLATGREVAPARFHAMGRLLDMLNKTYLYEAKIRGAEKEAGGKDGAALPDLLRKLNKELFSSGEEQA